MELGADPLQQVGDLSWAEGRRQLLHSLHERKRLDSPGGTRGRSELKKGPGLEPDDLRLGILVGGSVTLPEKLKNRNPGQSSGCDAVPDRDV